MISVELLHHTPIEIVAIATAEPYNSKPSEGLVERVFVTGHRSIARHSIAVFRIKDISQSALRQLSRHPHINLTVGSTRYIDMSNTSTYTPSTFKGREDMKKVYEDAINNAMKSYRELKRMENEYDLKDISKLVLPLASTTHLTLSGNCQALS